jgi:hypothetical protein
MLVEFQRYAACVDGPLGPRHAKRWALNVRSTVLLAIAAVAVAVGQTPAYDVHAAPQKATVSILALSSSVSVYPNHQDIYLADMSTPAAVHQLVKLVDVYSPADIPISQSVLVQRKLLRMTLVRDPGCDSIRRNFFLRSDDANIFDESARRVLQEHTGEPIPCFRVAHSATRLAK